MNAFTSAWLSLGLFACSQNGTLNTAGTFAVDADGDSVLSDEDCDDTDPAVAPGFPELCDGTDNDCDGLIDEGVDSTWYADIDQDGFGDPDAPRFACTAPDQTVANAEDCDDTDAAVHPDAESDACDDRDNDCDGLVDEDAEFFETIVDLDGDGFGGSTTAYCGGLPDNAVDNADDCDDADRQSFPGARETCDDRRDNDCDGQIDEMCYTDWSGEERFEYDFLSFAPGSRNCQIYWITDGRRNDEARCPGCEFSFTLTQRIDDERSQDDGTCATFTAIDGTPIIGDHGYTYSYHPDYAEEGPALLLQLDGGEWYPWADADLNSESGEMIYSFGYADRSRAFSGGYTVYYTYDFYGTAFLE
ncbi:MAG: putative metal-binding motif-containing protein [Myxococcota bacterium]